jgi:hypothetical protein
MFYSLLVVIKFSKDIKIFYNLLIMNYKVENDINFFNELYKSLDDKSEIDDTNKCLITNKLLTENFVTMECNHAFNYIPLYNDLINHKKKFNMLETKSGSLKINEIRCPYCRHKQTTLLPYYENFNIDKINGINYLDLTQNYNSSYNSCEYEYLNPNFDETLEESNTNKKKCICENNYAFKIFHPELGINDNKKYCYFHKKQVIQQYKKQKKQDEKNKLKEEQKKLKEKQKNLKEEQKNLKEEQKKEKEILKNKLKEEKLQIKNLKEELSTTENSIIQPTLRCIKILSSGINKNKPCGAKIVNNKNCFCKRHIPIPLEKV